MTTRWAWRAVDDAGRRIRGADEAGDETQLARTLERRGLLLVAAAEDVSTERTEGLQLPQFGTRRAVLEITRALAALLPAGLPLARALAAASDLTGPRMRGVLEDVRSLVERGTGLADALAVHPAVFSSLYVGVVRAGERSSDLDNAFHRLAAQLEREDRLRGRLLSAAIYPLILLVLGGVAVLVLLLFVIPRFADLLEGAGAALPTSTSALLGVATAVQSGGMIAPVVLILAVVGLAAFLRTRRGREIAARIALALPIVGTLRRDQLAARVARLMSVLLGGGAPLLSALDDAASTVGDPIARDDLRRVHGTVRSGTALHAALAESPLYPTLLCQLVGVGEESGRLEAFLAKAAELFEERTDRTVQRLVALLEPAMIVGFGIVVGFIALSLFQAIYGVNAGAFR